MKWMLTDCRYPRNMGFVNDPEVEITSVEQLAEILHQYAVGKPRIVILHSEECRTLQIGIGGKWAGVAHFPTEYESFTIRPRKSYQGEWTNYPYFGQPCSLGPDEVFEVADLITIIVHFYEHRAFPAEATLNPM